MTGACVVDLVAHWIAATPSAPAVTQAAVVRDYGALAAMARGVAARLRAAGLAAEDRVAVVAGRTPDAPAILLGVAMAGGVCVPMDAAHPRERLAHIAEDAGVRFVVTDQRDLAVLAPRPTVRIEELTAFPPSLDGHHEPVSPHREQLAYVLYTSGSTGRPKGVGITHGALANCLSVTRQAVGYRAGERLLAVTPLTFDIAMLELMLPLISGGEVVVADDLQARSGLDLARLMDQRRPHYLHATPLTWQLLFLAGWQGASDLVALIGGDRVPPALAGRLTGCTARVHHLYGPTEATMYAVSDVVRSAEQSAILPIGTPIDGMWTSIMDDRLFPTAAGEVGELCLGGAGLARGYFGRPALTAERFVPDPEHPGQRLYRTGDRARRLPDGRLELRGRNDDQVKIRGHRIELGEIENVVSEHPDVAVAAVVVIPAGTGDDQRIVAYVQLRAPVGAGPDVGRVVDAVRDHARRKLPQYMQPAAVGVLRTMPTTTTGKVDRGALSRIRVP